MGRRRLEHPPDPIDAGRGAVEPMNRHDRRKTAKLGARGMTTFWLSFTDPEAGADKRFLGVAIFDMDESQGEVSLPEIIKRSRELGVNPGGAVSIQEVAAIPDERK